MENDNLYKMLLKNIEACDEACKKPKDQMLLGEGSLNADVMFVGIAPNMSFDGKVNRSVFGEYSRAGEKVRPTMAALVEKYSKINNSQEILFWLTNIIKCGCGKDAFASNMKRCDKFLREEIGIIKPKVIVLFGRKIIKHFLGEVMVHGKISSLDNQYACVHSYHPAARGGLFENGTDKLMDAVVEAMGEGIHRRDGLKDELVNKSNEKIQGVIDARQRRSHKKKSRVIITSAEMLLLSAGSHNARSLFNNFSNRIKSKFPLVYNEPHTDSFIFYINYEGRQKRLFDVHVSNTGLRVHLMNRKKEIQDPFKICTLKMRKSGATRMEVKIERVDDIDRLLFVVEQIYKINTT